MREIKFRGFYHRQKNALYPEVKKWVYGYLFIEDGVAFIKDGKISYRVNPDSIGEYTGLKDKNGVEIYEGDIYRYGRFALNDVAKYGREPWNNLPEGVLENDISTEHKRFVVEWDYRKLLLLQRQIEENPDVDGVEVIGNIYENPELKKECYHG